MKRRLSKSKAKNALASKKNPITRYYRINEPQRQRNVRTVQRFVEAVAERMQRVNPDMLVEVEMSLLRVHLSGDNKDEVIDALRDLDGYVEQILYDINVDMRSDEDFIADEVTPK